MAKVTLEFDATEEQEEILTAINGWKYKAVVDDIFEFLRSTWKYDTPLKGESHVEIAENLRDEFNQIMQNYGL